MKEPVIAFDRSPYKDVVYQMPADKRPSAKSLIRRVAFMAMLQFFSSVLYKKKAPSHKNAQIEIHAETNEV